MKRIFKNLVPVLLFLLVGLVLYFIPTESVLPSGFGTVMRGEVTEIDDSAIQRQGLILFGTQHLTVRLSDGRLFPAENELRGQPELDKHFEAGDAVLVNAPREGESVLLARDHWRLGWAGIIFGLFCLLLCLFGGRVGVKSLMTFVLSCLIVWKILIPLTLKGYTASLVSFCSVAILTALIMYFVAGWTRHALAAFAGSMLGVLTSFIGALFAARLLHVDGVTMPFAPQLLYTAYPGLSLGDIFVGTVILSCSGALMDLSMDIAVGVKEVKLHNASLGFGALLRSGLRIGRAVTGTMTTTLLLAYSGGYLTLLMVFAAEGVSPFIFLNSTYMSAELVKTLIGSLGLVLVAPFTALTAAWIFRRK